MIGIYWTLSPYCWGFCFLPIVVMCALYRFFFTNRIVRLLAGNRVYKLFTGFFWYKQYVRLFLTIATVLFLSLTLLQPRWGVEEEVIMQEGRDLLIAIDISRSMLAKDYAVNRLEIAKDTVKKFLGAISCERVGLILFASSAFVQCPLTEDYGAMRSFVDMIDYDSVASGSTDIAAPILTALDVYERMPSKKNKLLVLLTDGEDMAGNSSHIQQRAHDAGLALFVVGIGTSEGAPIPCYDEHGAQKGHIMNADGSIVISRLNESSLQELVTAIGGKYIPYSIKDAHIDSLLRSVTAYEKELHRETLVQQRKLQYPWFIGAAFLAAGLEFIL